MIQAFRRSAEALAPELIAIRRHLHQNPEVSYSEKETAAYISKTLEGWGIPHRTGIGGYGIVADLPGRNGNPIVALRADMDALPIAERTELPFRSSVPEVAHLCGHDAHVTMLLGAAKILQENPEGRGIRLIFQAAEELGGARALVDEGVLQGIQRVVALHVFGLPVGKFGLRTGAITASVDRFQATIRGKGCHGASPHLGIDPVVISAGVVQALQGIISRGIDPREPAVLTVGRIQSGSQYNIIPEEAFLEGTIRCFHPKVREGIVRQMCKIVEDYPRIFGGVGELHLTEGHGPVFNADDMVEIAKNILLEGWNSEAIEEVPAQTFGEDLAYYGASAKTLLVLIGAGEGAALHNPAFLLDEAVLQEGAAFLASIGRRLSTGDLR